jgi:hypothetical protein
MAKKEDHMQPRKNKRWISVLAGVIILSGGLPLSTRHSTAQSFDPHDPTQQPHFSQVLEEHDKSIKQELKRRNQELEEKAQAEGRTLTEGERVRLVRRVVLYPHPDSPVKDVIVIAHEFSDGAVGRSIATPLLGPEDTEPAGSEIEAVNLDEGWYIVRPLTPEELRAGPKPLGCISQIESFNAPKCLI